VSNKLNIPEQSKVFLSLRKILSEYSEDMIVKHDTDLNYYLDTRKTYNKKPVFFGAVQIKKNYVSYHLMPVYMSPALLAGMSPELKKRMQGKSCFNFKTMDEKLFEELAGLTRKGYEFFKKEGWLHN
jgi:hypothetical protein